MDTIQRIKSIPIRNVAQWLGIDILRNNKALCFNHSEKTPSLSFNIDDNYFKCFGCDIKGGNIELVAKYRKISNSQAISELEAFLGVSRHYVPSVTRNPTSVRLGRSGASPALSGGFKKTSRKKNGASFSDVYNSFLNLLEFEESCSYLLSRGINPEISRTSNIRTLPKNSQPLIRKLLNLFDKETLISSGILIQKNDSDKPYVSLFSNRLIIPYYDKTGKNILNIQGRNIDSNKNPKYKFLPGVNTPMYYPKIKTDDSVNTLYLCEGVIDALSCIELGLRNPIGIAGVNNFSVDFIDEMYSSKVILAVDQDNAGRTFHRRMYLLFKDNLLDKPYTLNFEKLKEYHSIKGKINDLNELLVIKSNGLIA